MQLQTLSTYVIVDSTGLAFFLESIVIRSAFYGLDCVVEVAFLFIPTLVEVFFFKVLSRISDTIVKDDVEHR